MAAVGLGEESFESAAAKFEVDSIFKPVEEEARVYDRLFEYYKELYSRLKKVYRKLNSAEY